MTLSFLRLLSVPGERRLLSSGGRRWRQARSCRGSTATPRGALPGCRSEGCAAGSSLTSLGWVLGSTAGTASGGFSFLLQGGGVGRGHRLSSQDTRNIPAEAVCGCTVPCGPPPVLLCPLADGTEGSCLGLWDRAAARELGAERGGGKCTASRCAAW